MATDHARARALLAMWRAEDAMNATRQDLQALYERAWNDWWPNHLHEPLWVDEHPAEEIEDEASRRAVREALSVVTDLYLRRRDRGETHDAAMHGTYRDVMEIKYGPPPAPPRVLAPISGQLRIANGSFSDDSGPRCVTMCHAGDLAMRSSYDWDGAMRALDAIQAAGYHGVRTWTRLRWGGLPGSRPGIAGDWGHEIGTGWGPQLRRYIEACLDRGLVVHLAAGDLARLSRDGRFAYFEALRELCADFGPTVALAEWANESRDTAGGLTPADALVHMAGIGPCLTGLTAYTGHEDKALFQQWTPASQQFVLVHALRSGRWWDKIRHIFSLPYEDRTRRLWWHGEPWGVGKLVSAIDNQAELTPTVMALGAAQCLITGGAWTYFCSPGIVLGDERFEEHAGFAETPKVASALECVQEEHGFAWGQLRLMHGGANRPNVFEITGAGQGEARIDQAIDDTRGVVVATAYGETRFGFRLKWALKSLKTFDLTTMVWSDLAGDERIDGRKPCVLVGVRK